jgi:hypothetical protein
VAGILIMLINVIGGLFVGVLQHNLDIGTAARTYTLLTIGDGLVAQIPALIISIAAGMVVTRVGDDEDVSQQFISQLFNNPKLLYLTAAIIGLLGLIPGDAELRLPALAGALAAIAWKIDSVVSRRRQPMPVAPAPTAGAEAQEASWADVTPLDVLGLEVGYRLIPLVDKAQDGELLRRIRGIRKKFAQEVGFLVSPVHIRDNLELKPNAYKILLKGVEIGEGEAFPGHLLAINPGRVAGQVAGTPTRDPAFGLPAVWIDPALREQAQAYGYTVVDASTVVATHLNHLILSHTAELLGRQETQALLDHLAKEMPKLVEDLVPKLLPLGVVQKVLRNLLEEGVHLRDMRTIIETLADSAPRSQDPEALTAQVRDCAGPFDRPGTLSRRRRNAGDVARPTARASAAAGRRRRRRGRRHRAGSGRYAGPGNGGRGADAGGGRSADGPAGSRQSANLLSRFLRRSISQLKVLAHAEVPENIDHQSDLDHWTKSMNVRKFIAATARDALRKVKETLGPDAIILSNRGIPGGVEIMAVAARDMEMIVPTAEREATLPRRKEFVPAASSDPARLRVAAPESPAPALGPSTARAALPLPPFAERSLLPLEVPRSLAVNEASPAAAAPAVAVAAVVEAEVVPAAVLDEIRSLRRIVEQQLAGFRLGRGRAPSRSRPRFAAPDARRRILAAVRPRSARSKCRARSMLPGGWPGSRGAPSAAC